MRGRFERRRFAIWFDNTNLNLWKEVMESTQSRVTARGKCTSSVIANYGRQNKEKKSGLDIYFLVSAYHETSASAALAPTDSHPY